MKGKRPPTLTRDRASPPDSPASPDMTAAGKRCVVKTRPPVLHSLPFTPHMSAVRMLCGRGFGKNCLLQLTV